ncbi:MAG: homoserine kinase, partial [Staphylococcus epidermidis]|nr:homoserine kinase [Staphylococcus epidermidis]
MEEVLKLKIPASTANLGVGFDSIGMALDKYLHMSIRKIENIYQTAVNVARKYNVTLPSLQIEMRSDIPLARGLGSSASALVGALFIANYFGNIQLSKYELLQLATEIEGHPDNVAPTIYGGLIAGFYNPITKITD